MSLRCKETGKYDDLFGPPSAYSFEPVIDGKFRSFVKIFPKDKREEAEMELRRETGAFRKRMEFEKRRKLKDIRKTAKALKSAALAIRELRDWTGMQELPPVAARYFPEDCDPDTKKALQDWPGQEHLLHTLEYVLEMEPAPEVKYPSHVPQCKTHKEKCTYYVRMKWEGSLKKVEESAESLYLLGAFLEGVKEKRGRPVKSSIRYLAYVLCEMFNNFLGSKPNEHLHRVETGTEDFRGKKKPTKLGRFMLSVFEALGVEVTSKSLEQMLEPYYRARSPKK